MRKLNTQSGVATLLLVTLVGIGVIVGAVGMSTSLTSKKEASISAAAQTNTELMTWAGVNAFRQYLHKVGEENADNVTALPATIPLKGGDNQNNSITAANINTLACREENRTPVTGNPFVDSTCEITANIISSSKVAKATITLQTVFKLAIKNGQVINETRAAASMNLGGAAFSGIIIETEGEQVVPSLSLNIDGDLKVIPGIRAFEVSDNIQQLNLNVKGNVYIDCFIMGCETPELSITATGWVTLLRGGTYGDIHANGDVKVGSIVEPKNPTAGTVSGDNDDATNDQDDDADDNQKEYVPQYKTDEDGNYLRDENGELIVDPSKPLIEVINDGLRTRSITTQGNVTIREAQVAGDIKAGKNVSILSRGDVVGKVEAGENITVAAGIVGLNGANAERTRISNGAIAAGTIEVSKGRIEGIVKAGKNVQLRNSHSTIVGDVTAGENVTLWSNPVIEGNVKAKGSVQLRHSARIGSASLPVTVYAGEYVLIRDSSKVYGDVYGRGDREYKLGIPAGAVYLATLGELHGNAYSGKAVVVTATFGGKVTGKVTYSDKKACGICAHHEYNIVNAANTGWPLGHIGSDTRMNHTNLLSKINEGLQPAFFNINLSPIEPVTLNVGIKVDVRVYKDQANYIFNKGVERGVSRIYLNHLTNPKTGITYMYEFEKDGNGIEKPNTGVQKAYTNYGEPNQASVSVNSAGFYIGKYEYNGTKYVGAICENVSNIQTSLIYKSGTCSSNIIGYLPRVSVESDLTLGDWLYGLPQAYGYSPNADLSDYEIQWSLRSRGGAQSTPQNANFTPGILYFEGSVELKGDPGFTASNGNAYTNTILAEKHINAVEWSPRIYSPYNILREGNASLICNRPITTTTGEVVTSTKPTTNADTFLVPTNLCKDVNEFRFDMNRNEDNSKKSIKIDGSDEPMLDLGYVALMSNTTIRVGTCAKIYGDVLAKRRIEGSTAEVEGTIIDMCNNDSGQAITGQVNSQGLGGIDSFFLDGSKIIVPDERYTNDQSEEYEVPIGREHDAIENVKLQWTKFL